MKRIALAAVALLSSACTLPATPARAPLALPSAANDGLASYRYGFIDAAIECAPDWGNEPKHTMVFLSDVFGYCTEGARDPRVAVAWELASRAHAECPGDIRVIFDAVNGRDDRGAGQEAREATWAQADGMGRQVFDLYFVSALPRGACE